MLGYMIFEIEITDPEAWDEYRRIAAPIMAAGGGRFLANTTEVLPLEGGWMPATISIVEFPSFQAAHDFYQSPDYQRTIALRQKASRGRGVLVSGMPPEVVAR